LTVHSGGEMFVWHNGEIIQTELVAKQQVKVECGTSNVGYNIKRTY